MRFLIAFFVCFMPTLAFASFHSAPAPTSLIGQVAFNIEHFVLHVFYTAQTMFEVGPITAMAMLDGICFSATPPLAHVFFQSGFSAVLTTLVTLALAVWMCLSIFKTLFFLKQPTRRPTVA